MTDSRAFPGAPSGAFDATQSSSSNADVQTARPEGAGSAAAVIAALSTAVRATATDTTWLDEALRTVAEQPKAIARMFPAAGRRCGRGALPVGSADDLLAISPRPVDWTVDDAARVLMLAAVPLTGDQLWDEVQDLYRYGDAAEKRAVLRGLSILDHRIGDRAVPILLDALRTNDTRLVAAALGPYAHHLDPDGWRQAVLKCVFVGVPLAAVADLERRADAELGRMLAGLAQERTAAGRDMPADATGLLDRLTAGPANTNVATGSPPTGKAVS